jgi:hypothetical protein
MRHTGVWPTVKRKLRDKIRGMTKKVEESGNLEPCRQLFDIKGELLKCFE